MQHAGNDILTIILEQRCKHLVQACFLEIDTFITHIDNRKQHDSAVYDGRASREQRWPRVRRIGCE